MPDPLESRFRIVALSEGASFLALLGIAMPLKYLAGQPLAVTVVGMIHGILFLVYGGMVGVFVSQGRWTLARAAAAMVLAVVPFGTFYLPAADGLNPRREAGGRDESERPARP